MDNFWNGFEKRAVSVAWIKKMVSKGQMSRFKKHDPLNAGFYKDIEERIDKDYLKRVARGSSDRMHWDMSPDRDALKSAVKYVNRNTKIDPERAGDAVRYSMRYPGYLHGLRTEVHAPWKRDPEWAAQHRAIMDFVEHGKREPYTGLKVISGGKK